MPTLAYRNAFLVADTADQFVGRISVWRSPLGAESATLSAIRAVKRRSRMDPRLLAVESGMSLTWIDAGGGIHWQKI